MTILVTPTITLDDASIKSVTGLTASGFLLASKLIDSAMKIANMMTGII